MVTSFVISAALPHEEWNMRIGWLTVAMGGGDEMILNGWKEIAHYLGRGIRTAQRWELFGLPVRRPSSRLRSAVSVRSEEIDSWLSHCTNGREVPISNTTLNPSDHA
jgi:hypothetical protein